MLKELIAGTFICCCILHANAQNLIPNPGFEEYNNCPTDRGQIYPYTDSFPTVKNWINPLPNTSPDYYNTCATFNQVTVPFNIENGYAIPHSGNAYAGIELFTGMPLRDTIDDWREYLQVNLLQPLQEGHTYYVDFFVNFKWHLPQNYNIITVDNFGLILSVNRIDTIFIAPSVMFYITGYPSIASPPGYFITDTTNWIKIHGIYKATGGEQWATIGYFYNSQPIDFRLIYSPVGSVDSIHSTCYIYVDDVCVTDMDAPITANTFATGEQFPTTIGDTDVRGEYMWNTGDTTAFISVNTPGTYTRQSWGDCSYHIDNFCVINMNEPGITDTAIYSAKFPMDITGSPAIGGVNGKYLWSTGDTTAIVTIKKPGIYWRQSWEYCSYHIDTITVEERSIDECLWMPTAFTPNNDGRDDFFGPENFCHANLFVYNFSIYDRWGKRVFNADNPDEKWDGKYKGVPQETGTYFYMLQYSEYPPQSTQQISKVNNENVTVLKGSLTLLR